MESDRTVWIVMDSRTSIPVGVFSTPEKAAVAMIGGFEPEDRQHLTKWEALVDSYYDRLDARADRAYDEAREEECR